MKYRILLTLMAIVIGYQLNAQTRTPIVIPSGQQLYFDLSASTTSSGDTHRTATIRAPGYEDYNSSNPSNSTEGWNGYAKPGGNIIIPDSISYDNNTYRVTSISKDAFRNCVDITSVTIPNSVTSVGGSVFYGCSSLRLLTIGRGVRTMCKRYIGQNQACDDPILVGCTSLDTIYFNADSCVVGYSSGGLFEGNVGQHTTVVIGDNVRYIHKGTFKRTYSTSDTITKGIEKVIIGNSVTVIGDRAFYECRNLMAITFRSQNPPMLGSNVFYGVNADSVTCYIPCGRTTAYFNQWSTLFNYTEMSASYSLNVSSNYDSWGTTEIIQQPSCDGDAIIAATAACGYYFVRWSDGNSDNPRTLTLQNDTELTAIFASSFNVPDTVYIHDTTTITDYVHDTTYLPLYIHDTVPMVEYLHDTIYLPQYIHDTTILTNYLHDTIYIPQYIHDTTIVTNNYRDTIYLPQYIHDTAYFPVIDTLWLTETIHDTIIIHDTIYITLDGVIEAKGIDAKVYSSRGQIIVDGACGNTVTLFDISGRVLATKMDDYSLLRFDVPASGTYMIKIGQTSVHKIVVIR